MTRSQSREDPKDSPFEAEFLDAVKRRQTEAMNGFFDYFYNRIFGYLCHLVHDPNLAADLTQDTFLRIHRNLHRLDSGRDPTGWVFTIAVNTVRDFWRSGTHKSETVRRDAAQPEELPLTDGKQRVDEKLEKEAECQAVREALASLANDDQEIILLRNYQELDTAAIADLLQLKPDNVRQRHSRAVARLGQVYKARLTETRDQQ